jgi:predicted acyltransferase
MGTETTLKKGISSSQRLLSIDALRGFDMFWIIGGDALVKAAAKWADSVWPAFAEWPYRHHVTEQFEHVPWEGFHFYDLIFPLFLFVVGVVLPFSLGKLQEQGRSAGALYWRILRRTLLLFVIALIYNDILQLDWLTHDGNWHFDFSTVRLTGVLQRIAICYAVAAIIMVHTGARGQALIAAITLLGYWAILVFVPSPDSVAGDYSMEMNLAGYIDRNYLPGKILKRYYGYGDNEGILSTVPAVATTLLGVLAGHWLRSGRSPWAMVLGLVLAGVASLGLGTLWGLWFPIIKNIWTSSYVLVAGGWSLLLLAMFYGIIDVIRLRAWAFFFVVIGANAITIYFVQRFVDFNSIARFFVGGAIKHSGAFGPVLAILGALTLKWLFLLYLYRRRLFLRV